MDALNSARRVVIKIGSALLVDADTGELRGEWLRGLAEDIRWLKQRADVVLVSSGSIALGRRVLGLEPAAMPLEQSQAAAAVGQIRLAQAYQTVLAPHGLTAAQILLTLDDISDRRRYLNSRATLETLIALGAVPIVNENDTVATDEIRYGDNDRMAAQIAATVGADLLVLLSDVDGFYTGNPRECPTAQRFDVIDEITPEIEGMAGDAGTGLSKGGMKTKLMAARTATAAGCAMVIAHGGTVRPISALANGANATLFSADIDPQAARTRWIAAMKPRGEVTLDQGAERAVLEGRSLLPAGVTAVGGRFRRGDPVAMLAQGGRRLGQGLSRYSADEATRIQGHRSVDIEALLGYPGRAVLIHRDDMAFAH